jgi:hypothetical protein
MKWILAIICLFGASGCATHLMQNCEQQGASQYYHCEAAYLHF